MTKIEGGVGGTRSGAPVSRSNASSGSNSKVEFAKHLDAGSKAGAAAAATSAGPLSSVDGLIGLQEINEQTERRRKARQRANELLDRLEDLRVQLLMGGLSRDKLLQLARLVASKRPDLADPEMSALLDDIDLRVQVELAKHYSL